MHNTRVPLPPLPVTEVLPQLLAALAAERDLLILPLYGDLPAERQVK